MCKELVVRLFPFFSLSFPLKDLLWTGLWFLLHRHLHQSGALTMEALQDPPLDPMEGMEEDIADKVGPKQQDWMAPCRHHSSRLRTCAACCSLGVWAHAGVR